jgi:hypothetical protein
MARDHNAKHDYGRGELIMVEEVLPKNKTFITQ